MRDDATKDETFKNDPAWRRQKYQNEVLVRSGRDASGRYLNDRAFTTNSLSGNERNRTFLRAGDNFADVSLVSGADDLADGRSFVLLDYDGDGWQDLALMSLNRPRFKLYRNRLKTAFPNRQSLRIRLVGGQEGAQPDAQWSNRDGVGAKVRVTYQSGRKVLLQRQAGEGFAGQNSAVLHLGLPSDDAIHTIEVEWPSGKKSQLDAPTLDSICVIRERGDSVASDIEANGG